MKRMVFSEVKEKLSGYDVFVCHSSFEDRCKEIVSHIDCNQFQYVIICHFEDNYPEAEHNFKELREIIHNDGKIIELSLSKDDPMANYDKLYDCLTSISFLTVLWDVSTFTRELLLITIKLFSLRKFSERKVTLCYTPSDKYSSLPFEQLSDLWLSKGVSEIRSIFGYAGDFLPIKETLLIVLVGFEAERSEVVIDYLEPSRLYIGKATKETSTNTELAVINEFNFNKIIDIYPNAEKFDFSCKDIYETRDVLSNIVADNIEQYNIVISPMCNKISTLAAASVAFLYPGVQICYAATNLYNTDAYSTPSDYIYLIDIREIFNR